MTKSIPALQAELRAVFGPNSGALSPDGEIGPSHALPRSGSASAAGSPYLDEWTHNPHEIDAQPPASRPVEAVPVDVAPWGGWYTEMIVRKFLDGSADVCIVERPEWYEPGRTGRRADETFGQKLKREECMSDESRQRSAQRAKVNCRRACSQIVADRLGTLTFRDNVTDHDAAWTMFGDFVRAYRSELPYTFAIGGQRHEVTAFDYVCVPELQKRGAIHFHVALNRAHDINRLRRAWQAAQARFGLENPDGNVNIKRKGRRRGSWSTVSRGCARYIAKYIDKGMSEGWMFRKRYSVSRGIAEPELQRFYFVNAYGLDELLEFVAERLGARLVQQGEGKAGPFHAAYATFVPP